MEMWQKYIEKTDGLEPVLKTYLKLRRLFQSYDWSESDLANPPFYSREMMVLRDEMNVGIGKIKKELTDLGIDYDYETLSSYLTPFLSKINELTPLKYGNNERGNRRDEDY
jgi:hypothetical protein